MRTGASLLDLNFLWTQRKLISAILIFFPLVKTWTGIPVMKPTIFLLFLTLTPIFWKLNDLIFTKIYTKDPIFIVAGRSKSPSQKVFGVIKSEKTIIIFNVVFRQEFVNLGKIRTRELKRDVTSSRWAASFKSKSVHSNWSNKGKGSLRTFSTLLSFSISPSSYVFVNIQKSQKNKLLRVDEGQVECSRTHVSWIFVQQGWQYRKLSWRIQDLKFWIEYGNREEKEYVWVSGATLDSSTLEVLVSSSWVASEVTSSIGLDSADI